jgi:phospholipid/cholesterol/gamma-HCH transport system substrate-binding protein
MKKIVTNEFKVGMFIVLCLLGLFYLSFKTGKLNFKKGGYFINVVFSECAGLDKKAPVMLNGIEVGKVDDITISYDNDQTRIFLKLWLKDEARIRENAVVSIKTLGLMGEKYIQISSTEGKNFVNPGDTLLGKQYMDLDALMDEMQRISRDVTQGINSLILTLNSTVDDNKGGISNIIKNLESTSKNFEEFSADLKKHPWKLLFRSKEKTKKQEEGER